MLLIVFLSIPSTRQSVHPPWWVRTRACLRQEHTAADLPTRRFPAFRATIPALTRPPRLHLSSSQTFSHAFSPRHGQPPPSSSPPHGSTASSNRLPSALTPARRRLSPHPFGHDLRRRARLLASFRRSLSTNSGCLRPSRRTHAPSGKQH